jgi:hypothetical protein
MGTIGTIATNGTLVTDKSENDSEENKSANPEFTLLE